MGNWKLQTNLLEMRTDKRAGNRVSFRPKRNRKGSEDAMPEGWLEETGTL